jgi:hypothetical protein
MPEHSVALSIEAPTAVPHVPRAHEPKGMARLRQRPGSNRPDIPFLHAHRHPRLP